MCDYSDSQNTATCATSSVVWVVKTTTSTLKQLRNNILVEFNSPKKTFHIISYEHFQLILRGLQLYDISELPVHLKCKLQAATSHKGHHTISSSQFEILSSLSHKLQLDNRRVSNKTGKNICVHIMKVYRRQSKAPPSFNLSTTLKVSGKHI
jgi:hypothetical protein